MVAIYINIYNSKFIYMYIFIILIIYIGDICVNTLKRDWNVDLTLRHVLQVIRCLLIIPFPESSLNDEAGKLFMDSYEEYARRAKLMTEVFLHNIYIIYMYLLNVIVICIILYIFNTI
jgi:ubiquitin-protein ligase